MTELCTEKNERGFTIVEILTVSAMLVIIGYALSILFTQVVSSHTKVKALTDFFDSSRSIFMGISSDIKNAYVSKTDPRFAFTGSTNTLNFHAIRETDVDQMQGIEIGYQLAGTTLERRIDTVNIPEGDVASGGVTDVFADNVASFSIRYYYRNTPNSFAYRAGDWDSRQDLVDNYDYDENEKNPDGLPEGVEITITLREENAQYPDRSFTTLIYLQEDKY